MRSVSGASGKGEASGGGCRPFCFVPDRFSLLECLVNMSLFCLGLRCASYAPPARARMILFILR